MELVAWQMHGERCVAFFAHPLLSDLVALPAVPSLRLGARPGPGLDLIHRSVVGCRVSGCEGRRVHMAGTACSPDQRRCQLFSGLQRAEQN